MLLLEIQSKYPLIVFLLLNFLASIWNEEYLWPLLLVMTVFFITFWYKWDYLKEAITPKNANDIGDRIILIPQALILK